MKWLLHRAALLSVSAVLVLAVVLPASADFVPRVGYSADGTGAVVIINDRSAVRFRVPNAGYAPVERAQITASRLKPLAAGGWKLISVKPLGKRRAQVVAGDKVICIATKADSKATGMSAMALANTWARSMKSLFAIPAVTVTPREITVPEGESRTVCVGGASLGQLTSMCADSKTASADVHPTKRAIVVSGKHVGRCPVDVVSEGCKVTVIVNVKRYAARVGTPEIVEVTGNPAPNSLLELVSLEKAPKSIAFEPGGGAKRYGRPKMPNSVLGQGESMRVMVPVQVDGDGLIPTELLAPVDIVNRPVAYRPTAGLFYSNNPERVTGYGTLFTGKLAFDQRQRLFYHHQNMTGRRAIIQIDLINAGDTVAQVQAISGHSSPRVDPVLSGYFAGLDFMRDYLNGVGRIYRIQPHSKLVLYAEDLGQVETASGIVDLRELSGGDVYLKVSANPPTYGQAGSGDSAAIGIADVPGNLSTQVYAAPAKQISASYRVGDRWEFIRIGKYAIRSTTDDTVLDGNYGVIYNINIHVENPTADPSTVRVIFQPTAGPASGIFVTGGHIISVKVVNPPNEFTITSVRLAPGESRDISISTIPLGGSAYPATIVVRS